MAKIRLYKLIPITVAFVVVAVVGLNSLLNKPSQNNNVPQKNESSDVLGTESTNENVNDQTPSPKPSSSVQNSPTPTPKEEIKDNKYNSNQNTVIIIKTPTPTQTPYPVITPTPTPQPTNNTQNYTFVADCSIYQSHLDELEKLKQDATDHARTAGETECAKRGYTPPNYAGCEAYIQAQIDKVTPTYDLQISSWKVQADPYGQCQ